MVQTRAQVKSSGIKSPEVDRARNNLIPHMKPENMPYTTCTPSKAYISHTSYKPRTTHQHISINTKTQNWAR